LLTEKAGQHIENINTLRVAFWQKRSKHSHSVFVKRHGGTGKDRFSTKKAEKEKKEERRKDKNNRVGIESC
jgi:hypothetical protein